MSETTTTTDRSGEATSAPSRGARALEWWQHLTGPAGDPATLARLRRARSSLEALGVRGAVTLARRLGATHPAAPDWRTRDALDLARVLAHIRSHEPRSAPMRSAGWQSFAGDRKESDAGDDRPALSEARFRRLLQTTDGEDKVAAFSRFVHLMDGAIKVDNLANDFLDWNHPFRGDHVRERWAFDYYHAWSATPAESSTDSGVDA